MFVVQIEWADPSLPSLVGPFPARADAEGWGALNVVNGEWNVSPLADPYRGRSYQ